jgi:hypothetical protein
VELPEVTRHTDADEQCTQPEREDMTQRPRMKISDARDKQIADDRVEESPENVDR